MADVILRRALRKRHQARWLRLRRCGAWSNSFTCPKVLQSRRWPPELPIERGRPAEGTFPDAFAHIDLLAVKERGRKSERRLVVGPRRRLEELAGGGDGPGVGRAGERVAGCSKMSFIPRLAARAGVSFVPEIAGWRRQGSSKTPACSMRVLRRLTVLAYTAVAEAAWRR